MGLKKVEETVMPVWKIQPGDRILALNAHSPVVAESVYIHVELSGDFPNIHVGEGSYVDVRHKHGSFRLRGDEVVHLVIDIDGPLGSELS